MPVYVFESSFEKLNLFKEKYGKAFFFQSQQLVYIANNCPGTAKIKRADGTEEPIYNENGKDEISSGTYILKTIKAKGQVKISSLDGAITILSSVNNLFNIGRMRPVKQKK